MAIKEALNAVRNSPWRSDRTAINIITDSQSALKSLRKPFQQSGQHILREIIQVIARMETEGYRIHLRWVPAHEGIPGNEQAHQEAYKATEPDRVNQIPRRGIVRLKSPAIRWGREKVMVERTRQFDQEVRTG